MSDQQEKDKSIDDSGDFDFMAYPEPETEIDENGWVRRKPRWIGPKPVRWTGPSRIGTTGMEVYIIGDRRQNPIRGKSSNYHSVTITSSGVVRVCQERYVTL